MGGGLSYHPEAPSASMIHASAQQVQRRDLDHRSEFEPVACLEAPERLRYGIVIVLHRLSGRRDATALTGSARHSSHQ
jgi:hypothetical protein